MIPDSGSSGHRSSSLDPVPTKPRPSIRELRIKYVIGDNLLPNYGVQVHTTKGMSGKKSGNSGVNKPIIVPGADTKKESTSSSETGFAMDQHHINLIISAGIIGIMLLLTLILSCYLCCRRRNINKRLLIKNQRLLEQENRENNPDLFNILE